MASDYQAQIELALRDFDAWSVDWNHRMDDVIASLKALDAIGESTLSDAWLRLIDESNELEAESTEVREALEARG